MGEDKEEEYERGMDLEEGGRREYKEDLGAGRSARPGKRA